MLADLKYALRQLRKSPGFSATVILMLALGIGANAAVFSIVDAVMLRPLPYMHPEGLVRVESMNSRSTDASNLSAPDFLDWRARNHSFDHLVSYRDGSYTLTGIQRAVRLDGEVVTWDLLPLLGVNPELGRGFAAADEKLGVRSALISHSLWQSQFGSDRSIVGRAINLSGQTFTIVGVMPASFRFPVNEPRISLWIASGAEDPEMVKQRGAHFLDAIGRLKDGVTVAQADRDAKNRRPARARLSRLEHQA
jgi:putative ABC transport system permease protein